MTAPTPSPAESGTDVLVNFVLDKSGSMGPLAAATIEGFNAFVDAQRSGSGQALLSLTLFDTQFDVRFVAQDLREAPPLGSRENRYTPSGGTALYDAVVTTIRGVEAWLAKHPEFTGDVVTVIQTDGEENSSRTATLDEVNDLIAEKTKAGWEFVFLGTGHSAWTEGQKFTSIPAAARFAGGDGQEEHMTTYAAASAGMTRKRMSGGLYSENLRAVGMPDQE